MPGDFDDLVFRRKDVIVIAEFPQRLLRFSFESEGGTLFEVADKFERVRGGMHAFGENVDMIRHEAIGVNGKVVGGGRLE